MGVRARIILGAALAGFEPNWRAEPLEVGKRGERVELAQHPQPTLCSCEHVLELDKVLKQAMAFLDLISIFCLASGKADQAPLLGPFSCDPPGAEKLVRCRFIC